MFLSIYGVYIAPFQGIFRSAPSPGPGKKEGLKETIIISYNYTLISRGQKLLRNTRPNG